jgi:EmrB/QacA subfamily drug resistance transporter
MTPVGGRHTAVWTLILTSAALFIVTLDNLVVSTALPTIRRDLHASIQQLEWTVNAYTLTFAVLLLTGAALGDRFGRRRMFVVGILVFVAGSCGAALAPSIQWLIAARAFQGIGGAIIAPLTLTILSASVPAARRGAALGIWGAVGGLAVGLGPVVGGAVVQGASWQWIFWLNVPIGLALAPLAARRLDESYGPNSALDLPGVALASTGLLGVVFGIIRGSQIGWGTAEVVGSLAIGMLLVVGFVVWELRTSVPMLPMDFFANRSFTAANIASMMMFFGMFGAIFLLTQFLQTVHGYSPLSAGLRVLPWTAMPLIVAPIAGALSDRIGGRMLMAAGIALQSIALVMLAALASPTVAYADLVGPFVIAGVGMGLFFAPVATMIMSSVRLIEAGQASGANNAIRELGGVFGVAVLASIFAHKGGYGSASLFTDGILPALWVGSGVVAVGFVAALLLPGRAGRAAEQAELAGEAELEPVTA